DYTSAPTVTTLGGYRDISYLVDTANRRNGTYADRGRCIAMTKVNRGGIVDCAFTNYKNMVVSDAGCLNFQIKGNYFSACGKNDGAFPCIWVQSYGTPSAPAASYAPTEGSDIANNEFRDSERSAVLMSPAKGGRFTGNMIRDSGESTIFCNSNANYDGGMVMIADNDISGSVVTDIVSAAMEIDASNFVVKGNRVENCDHVAIAAPAGTNLSVLDNEFKNCYRNSISAYPFGPFAERYDLSTGSMPIAGTAISIEGDGAYFTIGSRGTNGGQNTVYRGNLIIETRSAYPPIFRQTKSGTNNIAKDVFIRDNILMVPDAMTFLNEAVAFVWEVGKGPQIFNNKGHGSGGYPGALQIPVYGSTSTTYLTPPFWGATGLFTLVADTIYLAPVWVPSRRTFTKAALDVTTSHASAVRVGIWNAKEDWLPGALVLEPTAATQVDVSTVGTKTTATFSKILEPGLYWLGVVGNGTPSLTSLNVGNVAGANMTGGTVGAYRGVSSAFTYGALGSLTAATLAGHSTSVPVIGIR
ncbi:MAG: right-handed parallel beta-helix repeat-containing protein, partial [Gemmatimonadaceae bacterium]|nr:right-handed parallel beta-helix repeat-containing protein [Gemmatimonadaceae bacterium]